MQSFTKTSTPAIAALFVPHWGCSHRCSFCNQKTISGMGTSITPDTVTAFCKSIAKTPNRRPLELAFFGGSFTCIPQKDMIALLEAAFPYIKDKTFTGVRVSTRPDALGEQVLDILSNYHVRTIEIGAQSMFDDVLRLNGRGHTALDVQESANRVKLKGFTLGLQMMTGLYGSNREKDWETARRLGALSPAGVRVYPTAVLRGTKLAEHMSVGRYNPMGLSESVALCAELLLYFLAKGIRVWRMGLPASPTLSQQVLGGAYHPAFRELVEGHVLFLRLRETLEGCPPGRYMAAVHPKSISKICGHRQNNLAVLRDMGYNIKIKADLTAKSWKEVTILRGDG